MTHKKEPLQSVIYKSNLQNFNADEQSLPNLSEIKSEINFLSLMIQDASFKLPEPLPDGRKADFS